MARFRVVRVLNAAQLRQLQAVTARLLRRALPHFPRTNSEPSAKGGSL